jgi:hypothetical protein
MKPRQRDLLSAEAKFLSDYSGEDALHRWREKLSNDERERLTRAPNPLQEAYSRFVEALGRILRVLSEGLAKILRSVSGAFASAWAIILGPNTELFGPEAL